MDKFHFRVLRVPAASDPEGNFHLLFDQPDHVSIMMKINNIAGPDTVDLRGGGIGTNLLITNKDNWSRCIAQLVDDPTDECDKYTLTLP
jgi:hypothetical protein